MTYPSGDEAYLRRSSRIGYGQIVQFRSKRDAEVNLDFIGQGLNAGTTAAAVRYRKDYEND